MRARLLGAALAVVAAPTLTAAQPAQTRNLACAAPTLLQCSIFAPGFDRWFLAPFGIAPPDAEMAAQVCAKDKRFSVVSMKRRPVGSGPLAQTTVLEVVCAAPTVARRQPARSPSEVSRSVLAGSPQDFIPQPESRGRGSEEVRRPARTERRAQREDARKRIREAETEILEPRRRLRAEPGERRAATTQEPPLPRPAPVVEGVAPSAASSADRESAQAVAAPNPAQDRGPASERVFEKPKPRRTPKDDPSISYEHF